MFVETRGWCGGRGKYRVDEEMNYEILNAWGVIYSEKERDKPNKVFLTQIKERVYFNQQRNRLVLKGKSAVTKCTQLFTIQQRFYRRDSSSWSSRRHSRKNSLNSDEDFRIVVKPKVKVGMIMDGQRTANGERREIVSGRCTFKSADEVFIFEAFCDASHDHYLKQVENSYRLVSLLGKGGYGFVFKCMSVTDQCFYAVKTNCDPDDEELITEFNILNHLNHKNVIKPLDFVYTDYEQYMVVDLAYGGSLYHRIYHGARINEAEARALFDQAFAAVAYLHENSIIHRDLKPENIVLMSEGAGSQVKLIDFGLSCYADDREDLEHVAGAVRYMSPEMLLKKVRRVRAAVDEKVDVWGLGVSMFAALCKTEPFIYSRNYGDYLMRMQNNRIQTHIASFQNLSEDMKRLIRRCLIIDPQERPSVAMLLHELHYFDPLPVRTPRDRKSVV